MQVARILPAFLLSFALLLSGCKGCTQAGTVTGPPVGALAATAPSFTVLPATQGEIIEYGGVAGANSLAAAIGSILSQIHQACGEKPNVGQVFSVKGTNSAAVFFTVIDHAQANRQLAGLAIAVQTGLNQFAAGVVSDSADRFAQTANPMMQQLFSAWNTGAAPGMAGGSAGSGANAPVAAGPMHVVAAPDNSASVSVPAGWTVDPSSFDGGLLLHGANGELFGLGLSKEGVDPTNAFQQKYASAHMTQAIDISNAVFYAYRGNPAKEFAPLMQAWLKSIKLPSTQLQVQNVQAMPSSQTVNCASASGQLNPNAAGAAIFDADICAQNPNQYGYYTVTVSIFLIPPALGSQDQALEKAIILTYKPNQQVMQQEYQQAAKMTQQQDQKDLAIAQWDVNRIHQQGAAAEQQMNETEDQESRMDQGFDNYLLDQSVVTNGAGHTTMWNSEANALVTANPNKYQIVDTPNYWKGVDY
ncbi:MAG: hypothetical protein WB341_01540 [Terracidiphilus sp.]